MPISDYRISNKLKKELKATHESISPQHHLVLEMGEILWSFYLLKRTRVDSDDALENMRSVWFGSLLSNDIILRLCKFRDNDSRSLSFEQVWKILRKRASTKERAASLESKIKDFKVQTQNLENHRDAYIAHLSKRDHTHLKPTTEILDTILLALQIIDGLCGEETSYKVLDVDVRKDAVRARNRSDE